MVEVTSCEMILCVLGGIFGAGVLIFGFTKFMIMHFGEKPEIVRQSAYTAVVILGIISTGYGFKTAYETVDLVSCDGEENIAIFEETPTELLASIEDCGCNE